MTGGSGDAIPGDPEGTKGAPGVRNSTSGIRRGFDRSKRQRRRRRRGVSTCGRGVAARRPVFSHGGARIRCVFPLSIKIKIRGCFDRV